MKHTPKSIREARNPRRNRIRVGKWYRVSAKLYQGQSVTVDKRGIISIEDADGRTANPRVAFGNLKVRPWHPGSTA